MNLKTSAIALALLSFISLRDVCAQSPGELYALGVNMGILSYQMSAIQNADNLPYAKAAWNAMSSTLQTAAAAKKQIDDSAGRVFLTDANPDTLSVLAKKIGAAPQEDLGWFKDAIKVGYTEITTMRTDYSNQLEKSGPPNLAQAYALGVNLGIVEGQATSGSDGARAVIGTTLDHAKSEAQALGLDLKPLTLLREEVFAGVNANPSSKYSFPLDDLHNKATSLRTYYQTLLK